MESQKAREPERAVDRVRRPYERPAVHWEENFEPYVYSTCAKMPGQGQPCVGNKNS